MIFVKYSLFVLLTSSVYISDTQQNKKFFRKDYKYIEATQSFYKIHTMHKTWTEATERCEMEGATLFYPQDKAEADALIGYWNEIYPQFLSVFIGISDLVAQEVYETIDGRSIADVYDKWAPYEPNNAGGAEDCVSLNHNGLLNDDNCNTKLPFVCKKKLDDLQWNDACNIPYSDYIFLTDLGRCYKFHLNPRNWTEAAFVCSAEQSYLAVLNSVTEANFLMNLTYQSTTEKTGEMYQKVHLGFHSRDGRGWRTSRGSSVSSSGYAKWDSKQPDGGTQEQCGAMSHSGLLHDVSCGDISFFICEHEPTPLRQPAKDTQQVTVKVCD